jgi:hypothetical protein
MLLPAHREFLLIALVTALVLTQERERQDKKEKQ